MREQFMPSARRAGLVVRELDEEVLVYDEEAHRAHCLNRTAALVWKSCDGETPVRAIAERVGEAFSSGISEEVVWLALERLAESGLLAPSARGHAPQGLVSRRRMIGRLALAAAISVPLVTSIVSPTPAEAQSPCNESNCPPPRCCSGGLCLPEEECSV
jgi:hypothetical protein